MVSIRDLEEKDIEVILPHVQKMFVEHDLAEPELFTPNSFTGEAIVEYYKKALKDPKTTVLIALIGKKIVGTIRCDIKETSGFYKERLVGYTDDLVVFDGHRRQGIGKALKLAAEKWFKEQGINLLECKIYEWNKPSVKLSESLGYKNTFSFYYKRI